MKHANQRKGLYIVSLALAAGLLTTVSRAQTVTLVDGNSSASLNLSSGDGMYDWTVDGTPQLKQQWFYYRVGEGGPQSPINAAGALTYNTYGLANFVNIVYTAPAFNIQVNYSLAGGGYGQSDITENISIQNTSANDLTLHFFQYSDFDLAGSPGGDTVQIYGAPGAFTQATQTKGPLQVAETITLPYANEAEVSGTTDQILNNLLTIPGYTLNNTTGPVSGDAAWAYEWDFAIAAGTSVDVIKDKRLSVEPIPEPATWALLGLGFAALVVLRRRP